MQRRFRPMSVFPTKVLVATDGSEDSQLASRIAVELAQETSSELHVVYVVPWPDLGVRDLWGFDASAREQAEAKGRQRLKELAEGIEASGGSVAESHFESGNPEVRIVAVAEELGAGFVVMGKTGYGGLRRAMMGSISDYVVRHSRSPVVVVGE
jgi:nucleotide-binding universal stress UspA family protein